MYYIRLVVQGCCKYLYNDRMAVYLPEYAKAFHDQASALHYLRGKPVERECIWWTVRR